MSHRIYTTPFASVYPHYVTKAEKKDRTKKEVNEIICWLTGYTQQQLDAILKNETDKVFALYELIATTTETETFRQKYLAGNFGYGHAKTELLNLVLARFANERELFNYYMNNLPELEEKLQQGAAKARVIAKETLAKVRASLGV